MLLPYGQRWALYALYVFTSHKPFHCPRPTIAVVLPLGTVLASGWVMFDMHADAKTGALASRSL